MCISSPKRVPAKSRTTFSLLSGLTCVRSSLDAFARVAHSAASDGVRWLAGLSRLWSRTAASQRNSVASWPMRPSASHDALSAEYAMVVAEPSVTLRPYVSTE